MIYHMYFGAFSSELPVNEQIFYITKWGEASRTYRVKEVLTDILEAREDHLIWVITPEQEKAFNRLVRSLKLKKYIIHQHKTYTQNPRYPNDPPRLKLVIMKGQKNEV